MKCIKLLCKKAIHLSVMDEASAIDGSRPLEQVADACGYAWGSTNVQMTADLTSFRVLQMVGKGFTPAQQAWPALTLEAFAQLGGKRSQKRESRTYAVAKLDRPCQSHEAAADGTPRDRSKTLTLGIGDLCRRHGNSVASWQIGPLRGWYFEESSEPGRAAGAAH